MPRLGERAGIAVTQRACRARRSGLMGIEEPFVG
jgi:hypothetical protein